MSLVRVTMYFFIPKVYRFPDLHIKPTHSPPNSPRPMRGVIDIRKDTFESCLCDQALRNHVPLSPIIDQARFWHSNCRPRCRGVSWMA